MTRRATEGVAANRRRGQIARHSESLTASGSGFFISADGYLVTNKHVVKGSRRLKVKTADGVFPAEVVRLGETDDLALLESRGTFFPAWNLDERG